MRFLSKSATAFALLFFIQGAWGSVDSLGALEVEAPQRYFEQYVGGTFTQDIDDFVDEAYDAYASSASNMSVVEELYWLSSLLYIYIPYQALEIEKTKVLTKRGFELVNNRSAMVAEINLLENDKQKADAYGQLSFISYHLLTYGIDFFYSLHLSRAYALEALKLDADNPYALYIMAGNYIGSIPFQYTASQITLSYLDRLQNSSENDGTLWQYLYLVTKADALYRVSRKKQAYADLAESLEVYPNAYYSIFLEDRFDQGLGAY